MVTVEVEAEDGEGTVNLDVTFAELLLHRVDEFGLMEDPTTEFILSRVGIV